MNIPDEPTDPNHRRREMNDAEAGSSGPVVPLTPAPADPNARLTGSVTRGIGLVEVPSVVNRNAVYRQRQRRYINVEPLNPRARARLIYLSKQTPRVSPENLLSEPAADNQNQTNVATVNQAAHNQPAPADPVDPSNDSKCRLGLVEIPNLVCPNVVRRQRERRLINVDLLRPPQKRPAPASNQPTHLEEEEKQTSVQPAPQGKQTTAQDNQLPPAESPDSRLAGFRLRYPNAFRDPQANPVPIPVAFRRRKKYPSESPLLQFLVSMEEQMKRTEIEMFKGIEAQLGFKSEDIEFENDSIAKRVTLLKEKMDKLKKAREGK